MDSRSSISSSSLSLEDCSLLGKLRLFADAVLLDDASPESGQMANNSSRIIASIKETDSEVGRTLKGRARRAGAGGEASARADMAEEVVWQVIGDRDKSAVKERLRSRLGASGEPDTTVDEG